MIPSAPFPALAKPFTARRTSDLEIRAAGVRAFRASLAIACPDHHGAGKNQPCWVLPTTADNPGSDPLHGLNCARRMALASLKARGK